MAEDKRFTTASATGAGLVGIEVFYNSSNRVPRDELIFKSDDGETIYLADILKDSAKNKSISALKVDDLNEDFLPKTSGGIDQENANNLLSFIKREKVMSKPRLVKNGEEVEISTAKLSSQSVYLRIKNTTETIDARSLLVDESSNKLLEEINEDDIKQEYQNNENLFKLLRGETLEDDDIVHFTYNGKYVAVDNTMYVKQGVATEATLEVGKADQSSLNREYYTAISTGQDKTPRYVESKQIIPPAYKKVDSAQLFDEEKIDQILAGDQIALNGLISYRKEDGTLGYRKNQEVAMVDGVLYAVPNGWYANPDSKRIYESKEEHIKRRVRVGELKTSKVTGGFYGKVTKKYNVGHDKFDVVIGGVKKTISCFNDHFVIDDDRTSSQKIIFATEDYPMAATSNSRTFRVKSYKFEYDEASENFKLDVAFVDNVIKNANATNLIGTIDNRPNKDEIISSKLVTNSQGKVTQIKSVLSRAQSLNGEETTLDLNNVSGINFNVQQTREFVGDYSAYKPAPMFDYKRDENGDIVYKKDENGNDLLDENGNKIPEEKEFVADIIQTSKVDEDGNLEAFNFEENDRLVKEFEQEVKKLQQELTRLKTSEKNEENLGRIKDIKQKLDEKLEKIKNIKDKTSIKTVDKLIEDYQNGEFFETFFFENGEMFEIKDGKKIALSSNTSADYNNLMKDLVGNYTIKNNKGKCEVVLGEKATSLIGGSLKIAETLYTLSFAPSFLSFLAMPLALTVGTGCIAFAGVTAAVNLVRNKIKQAQLNNLTPEKIKSKMNQKVKEQTKQDIKRATKEYEKEVKRIKKYTLDDAEREQKLQSAKDKFVAERGKIVGRLSLLDDITVESKYSVKDKKITSANIYGFAEFRHQKEETKRGKGLDAGAKAAYAKAIEDAKTKRDEKIALLNKDAHYASEKAKIMQAFKVESQDIKNTYLSQNGRPSDRVGYLKKTKAYLTADDKTRKQMIDACKEKAEKDKGLKEVATSTMLTSKNSSRIRSDLYEYIVKKSPDGVPVTPDEEAKILDQEEKLAIQLEDRELAKSKVETAAEKTYQNVAGFVKAVEKADQVVEAQEDQATEQLEAVKNATTGKAKKIKEKQDQAKAKAMQDKEEGQRKKQEKEEKIDQTNDTLAKENKVVLDTFLKDNQQVKEIVQRDELECYATVWSKMNGKEYGSSKEQKISMFLNDLTASNDADKGAMIGLIEKDPKFMSTYRAVLQDKNDMIVGELMGKFATQANADKNNAQSNNLVDDLLDKSKLVAMAQIFLKRAKNNNIALAAPRFKTKAGKPTYTNEEKCNIFLSGLAKHDVAEIKLIMGNIQKQEEYKKFLEKNSKEAESDNGVTQ